MSFVKNNKINAKNNKTIIYFLSYFFYSILLTRNFHTYFFYMFLIFLRIVSIIIPLQMIKQYKLKQKL